MSFYACKLPHGLEVETGGQTIILHGANIGEEIDNPSKNGSPRENRARVFGFGLTELNDRQTEAFEAWKTEVTTKDGKPLRDGGFPAFENGLILGPFKSRADAEKECAAVASIVTTGFEGVDPVEEENKKTGTKVKTRED
mgnify:CR=1 FL=1